MLSISNTCLIISSFALLFVFVSGRKHLLGTLLTLEALSLSLFAFLAWSNICFIQTMSFNLIFLTFAACEGALGLALLVVAVRWWGQDKILSLNLLQS